jgi:hypothetical protein
LKYLRKLHQVADSWAIQKKKVFLISCKEKGYPDPVDSVCCHSHYLFSLFCMLLVWLPHFTTHVEVVGKNDKETFKSYRMGYES